MKKLLLALFTCCLVSQVQAQSDPGATIVTHMETIPNPVYGSTHRVAAACKTAPTPCNWESASSWTTNVVPDLNTNVIVDGKIQITTLGASALHVGIYPGGVLSFKTDANTKLTTGDVIVAPGGELDIGTESSPIGDSNTAELVIRDLPFDTDTKEYLRTLTAVDSKVRIHGRIVASPFIATAAEAMTGNTVITLASSAAQGGWRVGDRVTIVKSTQCYPYASPTHDTCPNETEDRTITAISANGLQITLSSALQFNHPGARNYLNQIELYPHVLNKTRNVIIRSENPNGIRGHTLYHGRADVDIRYALFQSLGRTNIQNLGVTNGINNQKGRYPLHMHHLVGPLTPQPNGYQFTLIGNVVDFGSENRTQNHKWGLTVHGSHYGLIRGNIIDYASGAGLATEDASETGNLFDGNFVVRIIGGNGERTADNDPSDGSKLGRAGVAYWFNGGGLNKYTNNVAADVAECTYCYGFKFDFVYNGTITIPNSQGADPHSGGGVDTNGNAQPITQFENNTAYAVPNGLTIWWLGAFGSWPPSNPPGLPPDQAPQWPVTTSVVKNFTVWHHHRWGYFGYETQKLVLDGFKVRDDASLMSDSYYGTTGIWFADYDQIALTIRNADIQGAGTGIGSPIFRDFGGSPNNGITTIENSYINAGTGIWVEPPSSVNGSDNLPPMTLLINNVRIDHPAIRVNDDIAMTNDVFGGGGTPNLTLRNDVRICNYKSAPGVDGPDLYMIPTYPTHPPCDNTVGNCGTSLTAQYPKITGSYIFPLRGCQTADTTPPSSPRTLRIQ